jgi:hypothetical protein
MRSLFVRTTAQSSPLRGTPNIRYFRRVLDYRPCPLFKQPRCLVNEFSLCSRSLSQDPALWPRCPTGSFPGQPSRRLHSNCYRPSFQFTKPQIRNTRTCSQEVSRPPWRLEQRNLSRTFPHSYGISLLLTRCLTTLSAPSLDKSQRTPETDNVERGQPTEDECYPMVVHLSGAEDRICKLLDKVARNNGDRQGRPIRLRIAGGWVRDKVRRCSSIGSLYCLFQTRDMC